MSKARLIITAVIIEGRSHASVARDYGVSKGWMSKLVARYRTEGDTAFQPRSRRPHNRPDATSATTVDLVVELRKRLSTQGLDAGADTTGWHLQHHHHITLSRATIYRIIRRHNLVVDEPKKKPKSSYIRFQADQPNETWQADFTHHRLANGTDLEILTWLDDHSRHAVSVTAHQPVNEDVGDAVTHHRSCPLCEACCGLEITTKGEQVVRIRGDVNDPYSKGFICPKGSTLKQLHEDPDRLTSPRIRIGVAGKKRPRTRHSPRSRAASPRSSRRTAVKHSAPCWATPTPTTSAGCSTSTADLGERETRDSCPQADGANGKPRPLSIPADGSAGRRDVRASSDG